MSATFIMAPRIATVPFIHLHVAFRCGSLFSVVCLAHSLLQGRNLLTIMLLGLEKTK